MIQAPVRGILIHSPYSGLDILYGRAGIGCPDHAQATFWRTQCLDALQYVCFHFLWLAKNRDILSVDVQMDIYLPFRQHADIIQPIDEILRVENGNTALNEVRDDVKDVAIAVEGGMDAV